MDKKLKRSLIPLLSVHFIGTLGLSIMLPFLVFLVKDFKGNDFLYGLLGAMYSIFQFGGAPVLGRLSDHFGRKKILLISDAGTFVSWCIFMVAMFLPVNDLFSFRTELTGPTLITLPLLVLFIARAFDGLTGGNIAVATAYMADLSDDKSRKKNFGLMGAAANMGFIAGPLLAGALGGTAWGLKLPVAVTMAITFISVLMVIFLLPESRQDTAQEEAEPAGQKRPGLKFLLGLPHIFFLLVLYFFIFLGFNVFYTAFPLYAMETLKWEVQQMGIFFAFLSGLMILVQGPVLNRLSERFSDENLTIAGNLLLCINFLLLMSHNQVVVYIAAVFFSAGNGLMWPSFLSVLSRHAGPRYQGAIQGLGGSAGSLASIIGLVMGGILFHRIESYTFLIAAAVIFVVFLLCFRLKLIFPKQAAG